MHLHFQIWLCLCVFRALINSLGCWYRWNHLYSVYDFSLQKETWGLPLVFMISGYRQSHEDYNYSVHDLSVQTEPWRLPLLCLWFQCADGAMKTTTTVFMISVCRRSHEDCRQHRPCWLPALSVSPPEPGARFVEVLKYHSARHTAATTTAAVTNVPECFIYSMVRNYWFSPARNSKRKKTSYSRNTIHSHACA